MLAPSFSTVRGMTRDDDFEPRLGKQRSPHRRSYLHRVLRASNLAGGTLGRRSGKVYGSRIGKGGGVGRVLAARDRFSAYRQRRVMVKFSYKNLGGKGLAAAVDHLRYIQRGGVTREGERATLYSADQDRTDGKAFMTRAEDEKDKRQFRFIVSAEDAAEYDDLKPFIRRLMARMEEDLGTKLDWVAADHHNTGHPHTHIVVRGRDERGKDLIIAREYLTHGIRERAAELVSLDLGPRTDLEIENRLRREVEQERLTSIDRRLIRDMDGGRTVNSGDRDPFQQAVRAGRLQKLGRLGLAQEIAPGRWQLAAGLDDTLRRMSERGDIIRTMQRAIGEKGLTRAAADYAIYDPAGGACPTNCGTATISSSTGWMAVPIMSMWAARKAWVPCPPAPSLRLCHNGRSRARWIAPWRRSPRHMADAIARIFTSGTTRPPPRPLPKPMSAAWRRCAAPVSTWTASRTALGSSRRNISTAPGRSSSVASKPRRSRCGRSQRCHWNSRPARTGQPGWTVAWHPTQTRHATAALAARCARRRLAAGNG